MKRDLVFLDWPLTLTSVCSNFPFSFLLGLLPLSGYMGLLENDLRSYNYRHYSNDYFIASHLKAHTPLSIL